MLVGEPLIAVLLGVIVLGEHLAVAGREGLLLPLAVGAMMAATIALVETPPPDRPSASTPAKHVATFLECPPEPICLRVVAGMKEPAGLTHGIPASSCDRLRDMRVRPSFTLQAGWRADT